MIREYVVKVTDTFLPGAFQRFESEWAPEQELIRCKDCVYWQDNNDGYPHKDCKWREDETPDPDDYCSAGERKDENGRR